MAMTEEKDLEQMEDTVETAEAPAPETAEDVEAVENAGEEATEAATEETAEAEAEEGTAEDAAEPKKEGFFGKKKKKDKKDEQIEELNDKLKRQMAEFDNFRKRSEKEKSQMFDMGARTIIEKVLPVVDNFERGLAAVPEEQKEDAFVAGMDKVYKQLMTELDAIGVKAIEAVGQEFDPELHNAVMQVESEEYESGTVAQELQKGYTYKDTVVRHSMVAVVS
jgi:molecular chaperone GrpE